MLLRSLVVLLIGLTNSWGQGLDAYLQGVAARQLAARRAEVEAIRSKEDYEKRKARLRAAVLRMIGGLDEEKTPLNLKKTGSLDRGDYRVDKIVYESRPRFYVTANLYVPKTGKAPYPAILQPLGHSTTGKNRPFYQRLSIGLVKQGFVVLTYDPIGQGERRIYWDAELGDSKVGGTTTEHSMVGWQSMLGGESVARYRIWDGIRGLDLLESLPEVDRTRIGVTGCSGGGTLSTYIAALDARTKAAAPACYISSWDEQLKGTGPQDAEQQFADQFVEGLDHADWIGLAAPKPYLIASTDQDFFPLEGARKTFAEMKRIYGLYDAAAKVEWFHEPGPHGTPTASREAIYAWMKQWLKGEGGPVKEPELKFEAEEDLNVTPTGQVATSLGGETASTWNIKRFKDRVPARLDAARLREEVLRLTRYRASTAALNVQRGAVTERTGYRAQAIEFDAEVGLRVKATVLTPARGKGRMALVLAGRGSAEGDAAELAELGYTVLAIDMASTQKTAFLALMVGQPMVGLRMKTIVRGLDVLEARGEVLGVARGQTGTALLHAAVVEPRLSRLIVDGNLVSYHSVASSPIHKGVEELVVPGVLGKYDLPELAAAAAPRAVHLRNLVAANGKLLFRAEAQAAYADAARVGKVDVGIRNEYERMADAYPFVR